MCRSQRHDLDRGKQIIDCQRLVGDVRLGNFAWAVDNALFDACVVDNKALIVGARAANVARSLSEHLLYGRCEDLHKGSLAAHPGWSGSIALRVAIPKVWLGSGSPLKKLS